jgi:transcriptional regulator with XRE-family HTH domain
VTSEQTLGRAIGDARKALGLSQKDLAGRIHREDGIGSISPQYLNDIEHNRRIPGTDHMIREFAAALNISANYLFYLANRVPVTLRGIALSSDEVDRFVGQAMAFRRTYPRPGEKS